MSDVVWERRTVLSVTIKKNVRERKGLREASRMDKLQSEKQLSDSNDEEGEYVQ